MGHAGHGAGVHVLPVAQHGHPVGQLEQLFQAVGDKQNGGAILAQPAHDAEQVGHLGERQGGGGLVHDQNARVDRERAGNLDHLLLGDAQAARFGVHVQVHAQRIEQAPGLLVHRLPADPAARDGLAAGKNILGDVEVGEEAQFLVNGGDAAPGGLARVGQAHHFTVQADLTPVRLVHPGDDFHQGRFPGPVFAQQRVHLARAQVELHAAQGMHPGKALRDIG